MMEIVDIILRRCVLTHEQDSNCLKPCMGKTVDLGGVFHPFGGLIGAPGLMAGGDGLLERG